MPITPTSTLSKNYQALGIDEIANDIETVFTSVNSLETTVNALPAAPTTTIVNISSAQILGTASTDITLLPNLAIGTYYKEWTLTIELDFNSIAYDLGIDTGMYLFWGSRGVLIDKTFIESAADNVLTVHSNDLIYLTNTPLSTLKGIDTVNSGVFLTTNTNAPITGNSPLRVIAEYTTRTFGA